MSQSVIVLNWLSACVLSHFFLSSRWCFQKVQCTLPLMHHPCMLWYIRKINIFEGIYPSADTPHGAWVHEIKTTRHCTNVKDVISYSVWASNISTAICINLLSFFPPCHCVWWPCVFSWETRATSCLLHVLPLLISWLCRAFVFTDTSSAAITTPSTRIFFPCNATIYIG